MRRLRWEPTDFPCTLWTTPSPRLPRRREAAPGNRPPQRAAAAGLPGGLLPPVASGRHRGHHAADGRARLLLASRLGRAAAGRTVPLAGQAELHGPAGGRNPHARLAAAPGGPAANRLRRGARLAEPGEFTLRAFLAGRIDLTQAEAVLGRDRRRRRRATPRRLGPAWPAAWLGRSTGFATGCWTCWPTWRPASTSPKKTSPSPAAGSCSLAWTRPPSDRRPGRADGLAERGGRIGSAWCWPARPTAARAASSTPWRPAGALVSDQPGTTRDYLVAEIDLDGARFRLIDTAGASDRRCFAKQRLEDAPRRPLKKRPRPPPAEQRRQADVLLLCVDVEPAARGLFFDSAPPARVVALTKSDLPRHRDFDAERTRRRDRRQQPDRRRAGLPCAALREAVLACRGGGGDVVPGTASAAASCWTLAADASAGRDAWRRTAAARNSWRPRSARPWTNSAKRPAPSTPRTCSIASSAASASGSDRRAVTPCCGVRSPPFPRPWSLFPATGGASC